MHNPRLGERDRLRAGRRRRLATFRIDAHTRDFDALSSLLLGVGMLAHLSNRRADFGEKNERRRLTDDEPRHPIFLIDSQRRRPIRIDQRRRLVSARRRMIVIDDFAATN